MPDSLLYRRSDHRVTEVRERCLPDEPEAVRQKAQGRGEEAEGGFEGFGRGDLVAAGFAEGIESVTYEADKKIERSLRRRAEGPLSERKGLSRFLLPWPFDCGYSCGPSVGGGVEGAGIGGINRESPRLARPRRFRSETRGGGRGILGRRIV